MIKLPDPQEYDDPIRYFRDSHNVITSALERLDVLVSNAREIGVTQSFQQPSEWLELLEFFALTEPSHERDEERSLFPIVTQKVPHLGFQSPLEPNRFIHEQHESMQQRAKALLSMWKGYIAQQQLSAEDEERFLDVATELIKVYVEHIAMENAIIYTMANDDLLSPAERIAIMLIVRDMHSERSVTPVIGFEDTVYKNTESADGDEGDEDNSSNAVAAHTIESDDDDEEDE